MSYTPEEQEIYEWAKSSIPRALFNSSREEEEMGGLVKVGAIVKNFIRSLFRQSLITQSTAGPPDFTNQHAIDRGTSRQNGESTATLQERIRTTEAAITRPALLETAQGIVDASGVVGTVAIVELKRDGAHYGSYTEQSGTGGTFSNVDGSMVFTPATPFAAPVEVNFPRSGMGGNPGISISGAAASANNGTYSVTNLYLNGVKFNNTGVIGIDPTVSWVLRKRDALANVLDNHSRSYFGRGYRMWQPVPTKWVFILPYGTTAGTAAAVYEAVRQKKAAGQAIAVERRLNP